MSETQFATALDTLGQILPADPGRDAIHLATYAVVAGERLFPGQHIGLKDGKASASAEKLLGIVDPFLPSSVHPDQMFWLVLYPRTITSLRHVWDHPQFGSEVRTIAPDPAQSEKWLREYIEGADCPSYDTIMDAINGTYQSRDDESGEYPDYYNAKITGEYFHFGGHDAHGDIPPEFWDHVEAVTGKKQTKRPTYWSCSC